MKTIELIPQEWYLFKELANKFHLSFMMEVVHGIVIIEADSLSLEHLGY